MSAHPEPALSLAQLLQRLSRREVMLSERDGSLCLGGGADTLNGAERDEIRCRAPEILEYLRARKAAARSFAPPVGAAPEPAVIQEMWWGWCRPAEPQLPHEKLCVIPAIEGDEAVLARSVLALFERHATLRTHFREEDGRLKVATQPVGVFEVETLTLDDPAPLPEALPALRLRLLKETHPRIHDDRLSRAFIVKRDGAPVAVAFLIHHMVMDARSLILLEKDLRAIAAAGGDASGLEPAPQFTDYAAWERAWLGDAAAPVVEHWRNWLHQAPALHGPDGRALVWAPGLKINYDVEITGAPIEAIRKLASRTACTSFTVLLAAVAVAASRWSGSARVPIRVIGDLRTEKVLVGMVGNLVCTDLLEMRVDDEPDPAALLQQAAAEYTAATRLRLPLLLGLPVGPPYPDVSADSIGHKTPITINYFPMYALRGPLAPPEGASGTPVVRTAHEESWPVPMCPINLRIWDYGGRILGKFEFNQDLIEVADQHRFCDLFVEAVLELTAE